MTQEEIVISLVRILGALPVLRWPFAGAVLAILVDLSDLFLMNLLHLGGVRNYQAMDKWLDLAYMVTFLIVALRWSGLARNIACALFAYRILGVVIFEIVGSRELLLFFPNVFEFWFVGIAAMKQFRPQFQPDLRWSALALAPMLALKEFQEYALHWAQWLDRYRAVDLVKDWWRWLTGWI